MSPVFLVGVALFMGGGITFLGILFSSGGASRSKQFAVIGEVLRGGQGKAKRAIAMAALVTVAAGAMVTFAGVGAMDRQRVERCEAFCREKGFEQGRVGPSIDREPKTRFVACTCTRPASPPLEVRVDSLTSP